MMKLNVERDEFEASYNEPMNHVQCALDNLDWVLRPGKYEDEAPMTEARRERLLREMEHHLQRALADLRSSRNAYLESDETGAVVVRGDVIG